MHKHRGEGGQPPPHLLEIQETSGKQPIAPVRGSIFTAEQRAPRRERGPVERRGLRHGGRLFTGLPGAVCQKEAGALDQPSQTRRAPVRPAALFHPAQLSHLFIHTVPGGG